MSLKLWFHPLSSYSHKVLVALYENDVSFEPVIIDGGSWAAFAKLWPVAKFPVLQDASKDRLVPESSIIIEYLDRHHPGKVRLIPEDPDRAREVRLRDRFFDQYLHTPMQKFSDDRLRPADRRDPFGLEQAGSRYRTALDMVEKEMADRTWAMGDEFTMADCAAAPALFYGDRFYGPFRKSHPNAIAYLDRLMARPSYARALKEAEPYMHLLPD